MIFSCISLSIIIEQNRGTTSVDIDFGFHLTQHWISAAISPGPSSD
jgi:hypothetical protein